MPCASLSDLYVQRWSERIMDLRSAAAARLSGGRVQSMAPFILAAFHVAKCMFEVSRVALQEAYPRDGRVTKAIKLSCLAAMEYEPSLHGANSNASPKMAKERRSSLQTFPTSGESSTSSSKRSHFEFPPSTGSASTYDSTRSYSLGTARLVVAPHHAHSSVLDEAVHTVAEEITRCLGEATLIGEETKGEEPSSGLPSVHSPHQRRNTMPASGIPVGKLSSLRDSARKELLDNDAAKRERVYRRKEARVTEEFSHWVYQRAQTLQQKFSGFIAVDVARGIALLHACVESLRRSPILCRYSDNVLEQLSVPSPGNQLYSAFQQLPQAPWFTPLHGLFWEMVLKYPAVVVDCYLSAALRIACKWVLACHGCVNS